MVLAEVFGVVALVGLVFALPLAGLVDVHRHPEWAWAGSGQNKRTWTVLMALSFVFFIPILSLVGVVSSGIYWVGRRKKVIAAEAAGQFLPSPSPAAWPPGWYPDPSGQTGARWWDGRTWTDQIRA